VIERMTNTSDDSGKRRQYFSRFDIFSHFALNSLCKFDISQQSAFRLRLQLFILEFFQSLLGYFAVLPCGKELQMLIIVVIGLERAKSHIEFNRSIWFKDGAFWENLEDSHVLSI
jgi:hypothetical protein